MDANQLDEAALAVVVILITMRLGIRVHLF